MAPSPTTPSPPISHQRSASTGSTPTFRLRPAKRLSQAPPVTLPVLPYTSSEWKRTIADIKRQHFSRRYRACSARCTEILENIKDVSQVEPVYIIYLHFYAATSMELCARTLPPSSASRASLLQQARTHFDQAASLINIAEDSVVSRTQSSSISSSGSSCHSPSESISSRAATPETRLTSPTTSVCSFDDLTTKSCLSNPGSSPTKRVKKVSFSLPQEETIHIPSPLVRPDSPTLGFDNDSYFSSGASRQQLPQPPSKSQPPLGFREIELPLTLQPVSETEPLQLIPEDDAFLMARSVDRFCENLSSLRAQLSRHTASVDNLLAQSKEIPAPGARGSLLLLENATARMSIGSAPGTPGVLEDEFRRLDRQARIERLRKSGWQRKRFDARRYEELCESVLSELA
ncbi:hypothetical protein OQA88_3791 [Cercophora sp. LCS_1]